MDFSSFLLPAVGFVVFAASLAQAAGPVLQTGDRVAICGDSITEQKQYSVFLEDYFLMCQPAPDLRAVQIGWAGERASGLQQRLASDVLPFRPQVVTMCYGMNDGAYGALTLEKIEAYREALTGITRTLKASGVRTIVIGSPGFVDPDSYVHRNPEMYNETLAGLGDVAKQVAEREGAVFADVHAAMKLATEKAKAAWGPGYLVGGTDGIHPDANGHLVMAYAFLKALGCDGQIGTITMDLSTGQATGTEGHRILSSSGGQVELESARYPFCFSGDPKDPAATSGIIDVLPFNEELNRYLLVVRGLQTKEARVIWGEQSKSFSATELETGINLAAEFLQNPFSSAFAKVDQAVRAKQESETLLAKGFLHHKAAFQAMAPGQKEALERVAEEALARNDRMGADADALVTPVRHTIRVEPIP